MEKMNVKDDFFQTRIPHFWPISLLLAASMALKMTGPKIYLFSFSLKNVIETLVNSVISATLVEISFFVPIIVKL